MSEGTLVPDYYIDWFNTEKSWRVAVEKRNAVVIDAPEDCGHPEGTLFAKSNMGTIGLCFPDGIGQLLKPPQRALN